MAEHYIMSPAHQAANVASARDLLVCVGEREREFGLKEQAADENLVSQVQSAITAIMVAALDLGTPPAGLVHAMGFSLGTYFAQCGVIEGGLQAVGRSIAAGVKASDVLVVEPEGHA